MNANQTIKYQSLKDAVIEAQKQNIENKAPFENIEQSVTACMESYNETCADYNAENLQQIVQNLKELYPYMENYFDGSYLFWIDFDSE